MSDVFISHSTQDKAAAEKVVSFLEEKGLSCWIAPRDIVPGSDWAASISTAITTSKVFLVIYSANSAGSNQVSREVSLAESKRNIFVVPYKIDDTELSGSFEYYLTGAHWITADYSRQDYKLEELYNIIAGITGKNVQNITNNTYIDHLHIHGEGNLPEEIQHSVQSAQNAASPFASSAAPAARTAAQAPAPAAAPKKKGGAKKWVIIAIVAVVLIASIVVAVIAPIINSDSGSSSKSSKKTTSSASDDDGEIDSKDDIVGKWECCAMTAEGLTITGEYEGVPIAAIFQFEFDEDGSFVLSSPVYSASETYEGTWKFKNDTVKLTIDGRSETLEIDGEYLLFEDEGISVKLEKVKKFTKYDPE